ncbi:MAG: adenylate/guanylate cyclase domain-containing protein, partial [Proteobacteria bacterium]|nr:adenylate/guanylate cyclase domain-containing protein [Pseudomonadota bacterium]
HDDAIRAVKSAIAIQQKAKEIDSSVNKRNGLRLKIGIGISTGKVFSGILGSLRKKEFTSIGMAVNIAARLENMAKEGEILINESTFKKIEGRIDVETLSPAKFKGISEPVKIYSIKIW